MTNSTSDAAFDALAQRILDERWQAYPNAASGSGLHEYDGRLPALSPSVIERESRSCAARPMICARSTGRCCPSSDGSTANC